MRSVSPRRCGDSMTFTVSVDASDIEFPCETGETVLDAAERAGYSLPYSCRKGVCATCEGDLRRGEVAVGSRHFAGPSDDVLLCQARPRSNVLIHPRRIQRRDPDARKTVTAKVYRINRPVDDVAILQLRFPAGIRAKFLAGQYLRIKMPDGDTRNFSMANPPHESDGVQLHIRHVPGGRFSEGVLAELRPGDTLDVELPYGDFHLRPDSDKPVVCLATGTGFAPLKSIVEDLIKRGNKRPVHLYWGGRRARGLVQVHPGLVGARSGLERSCGPGPSRRAEGSDRFVGVGGLCLRQPTDDPPCATRFPDDRWSLRRRLLRRSLRAVGKRSGGPRLNRSPQKTTANNSRKKP